MTAITASLTDATANVPSAEKSRFKIATPDTVWNTVYMNAAIEALRVEGYPVRDEDLARLSPFVRHHLGVHGRYSFVLPDLSGGIRPLRDPDAEDDDRE